MSMSKSKKHPTTLIRHIDESVFLTSKQTCENRLSVCEKCPAYTKEYVCEVNAVFMPHHARLKASRCPSGLWAADYDN